MRVTTRPGAEGVPRWSWLGGKGLVFWLGVGVERWWVVRGGECSGVENSDMEMVRSHRDSDHVPR